MLAHLLIFVLGSISFLADVYNWSAFNSLSVESLPVYVIAGILFFRSAPHVLRDCAKESSELPDAFDLVLPAVNSLIQVSITKDVILYKASELAIYQQIPFKDYTPVHFIADESPKDLIVYKTPELAVFELIPFRDYTPVHFTVDQASKDLIVCKTPEVVVYEPMPFRDYTPVQFILSAANTASRDLLVYRAPELAVFRPIPFRDYSPVVFEDIPAVEDRITDIVVYQAAAFDLAVLDHCHCTSAIIEITTDIVVYQPKAFELAVVRPIHFRDYTPASPQKDAPAQSAANGNTIAVPFRDAWLAGAPSNTMDAVSRFSITPIGVVNMPVAQVRVYPLVNLYGAFAHFDGTFSGDIAAWNALDPVWRYVALVAIFVHVLVLTQDGQHWRRATWSQTWIESLKAKQR